MFLNFECFSEYSRRPSCFFLNETIKILNWQMHLWLHDVWNIAGMLRHVRFAQIPGVPCKSDTWVSDLTAAIRQKRVSILEAFRDLDFHSHHGFKDSPGALKFSSSFSHFNLQASVKINLFGLGTRSFNRRKEAVSRLETKRKLGLSSLQVQP